MQRNQITAIIATVLSMLMGLCLPCESQRYHDVPGLSGASGAARADNNIEKKIAIIVIDT